MRYACISTPVATVPWNLKIDLDVAMNTSTQKERLRIGIRTTAVHTKKYKKPLRRLRIACERQSSTPGKGLNMKIFGLHILTEQSHYKAISEAKAEATQKQRNMNTNILSKLLAENLKNEKAIGCCSNPEYLRA